MCSCLTELKVFAKQQYWKSAGGDDVGQSQESISKLTVWHGKKTGQFVRTRLMVVSLGNMRMVTFTSQH